MTIEDLMKPRYKVIADYPNAVYEIGTIMTTKENWAASDFRLCPDDVDKYPHLFRKLEWWEDRDEKDMPEYVKDDEGIVGKLGERYSHNLKNCVCVTFPNGNAVVSHLDNWQPATLEEYTQYTNKQKQST